MKHPLAALAILASMWSLGCDDFPSQPLTDFETEDTRFYCRDWHPVRPTADRALFDMYFLRGSSSEDPSASVGRQRIKDVGGVIVHEFAVDGLVRVLIATDDVATLWPYANYAQGVTNAHVYLTERTLIVYTRAVTESDLDVIRNLGGRVIERDDRYLLADLEDRTIRALLLRPEVEYVSGDAHGCAD